MKKRLLLISILLLSLTIGNSQNSSEGLNRIIDDVRIAYEMDGLTVAVVETEKIFYGISGIPNTVHSDTAILKSKIHLGSISKTITSFVAMKMVEDGLISLDDKLGNIVPELSGIGEANSISLGDLLTNKANLGTYTKEKDFKKVQNLEGSSSQKMMLFAKTALQKKSKNEKFSNASYIMAALMIEKASKIPFDEVIRKVVEDDLKLSCFTSLPDKNGLQNFWGSWGDSNVQIAHFASKNFLNEDYLMPAEGISMDIVDYSKIVQLNLNGLLGDSNYLNYDSYSKMHFNGDQGIGYGWRNSSEEGYKTSYHDNQSNSYFYHSVIIPRRKIAIIIMAQIKDISGAYGVYDLRAKLVEKYQE